MEDELVIEVEGSSPLVIPLRAARPEPILAMPEVVDMGVVLIGTCKTLQIPLENTGGSSTLTVQHGRVEDADVKEVR